MTNTTKEFNLNQRNMISLAFMLDDNEIRDMFESHLCWLLNHSEFDDHIKEYIRNVFDRLVKESKPLLECISRDEVIEGTKRLWKVNEQLASVNIKLKKEVIEKLDKHNLEMMEMVIDDMGDKVREFNKGIEEIIKFYESL